MKLLIRNSVIRTNTSFYLYLNRCLKFYPAFSDLKSEGNVYLVSSEEFVEPACGLTVV